MQPTAILRSPLIHFLLMGMVLFALRDRISLGAAETAPAETLRIRFDTARIEGLRADFKSQLGHAPTAAELDRLITQAVDEELLFREAITRGLQENDDGVETRLAQKMLFVDDAASSAEPVDPALLAERARRLGLDQDDVVIRRLLVQKLRLSATALSPEEFPSEDELARDYSERREALREPERRSLVHVFLSRDRRGASTREHAESIGRRIAQEGLAPDAAVALGDGFPFGHAFAKASANDLERRFGADFARRTFTLPVATWSDPIESAYGLHLVRVEEIVPGAIPPFETVRDRLRGEYEERLRDRKLAALLAALRTRYEVAVARVDAE